MSQANAAVGNPLEQYSDGPGQAIIGADNVLRAIRDFNEKVIRCSATTGPDAFVFHGEATDHTQSLVVNIGPLEIDISIDLNNYTVVIEVYLHLIWTKIQIAKASGSLSDGITLTIGYPDILGGTLKFTLEDGDVMLAYDFTAFGFRYTGKIRIFRF
ncbi:hypothetical protein J3A83DRAFT_4257805 [Scleroderma citrinum]